MASNLYKTELEKQNVLVYWESIGQGVTCQQQAETQNIQIWKRYPRIQLFATSEETYLQKCLTIYIISG